MINLVQNVVDGISVGSLYALTALGIGLIFGVMRLINVAHGELITAMGYTMLLFASQSVVVAMIGGMIAVVLLALVTERVAFRPLRSADPATLLVASFAVSFFLQKSIALVIGYRPKGINILPSLGQQVVVFGVRLQLLKMATIAVVAVMLILLTWFLKRTRFGLEMRAAAENFRMAQLLGIRGNRVIAMAFALSAILAAAVAVLFISQSGFLTPRMGLQLVVIAFVGTVIGGLGSLVGAAAGGFFVGATTVFLQAVLPPDLRQLREAFVYLVVILVLLLRPQGLFPASGLKERV
ncbi:MAG TPA: branched-chain amino acid ABC transporter permease [Magnetospirillaceae bacterium]